MATQEQIDTLISLKDQFDLLDKEKIYRTSLGTGSREQILRPKIEAITKKMQFALENGESVHQQSFHAISDIFDALFNDFVSLADLDDSNYLGQGQSYIENINSRLEELKLHWFHVIAAGIEQKGLLDDESIKIEHQRAIEKLRQEADETLQKVQEETEKTIAKAEEAAEQIENKARLTAVGISVEVAQDQFEKAQEEFKHQSFKWGIFSGISILVFIVALIYFASNSQPNEKLGFGIIYFTALRITILAAIGGVAAFCLKILRANMHMRAHNLHRQRLANSMAAFVESASTNEQRDLILAHLVDAIASFGSSGLLTKPEDSMNPSKMTIDTITRTLTGSST